MPEHNRQYLPNHAQAITASDATVLDLVGLYVGGAGNVSLLFAGDTAAVTFSNVPAGTTLVGAIKKVMAATTATSMVGLS